MIEKVTVNVLSKVRNEKLGGREYVVAPVSMLVPGVLNGSKGALFYPKSEVVKNAQAWNFMPLTLGHPTDEDGNATTARSPRTIEKFGLGFVFNVSTKKGKLDGEAWFDTDRTRVLAPSILKRLSLNQPIELSTGLFTDNRAVRNGNFNGRRYDAVATNYKPDHLAVLLNTRGACSLQDGCGVLINQDFTTNIIRKLPNGKYRLLSKDGKKNLGTFDSLKAAKKHEGEVQFFKHQNNECSCEDPNNCDCEDCTAKRRQKVMNCEFRIHTCQFSVTNAKDCGAG